MLINALFPEITFIQIINNAFQCYSTLLYYDSFKCTRYYIFCGVLFANIFPPPPILTFDMVILIKVMLIITKNNILCS